MKVKKFGLAIAFAISVLVLFSSCEMLMQELSAIFNTGSSVNDKMEGYVVIKNFNSTEILYAEEWTTLEAGFVTNSDGSKTYNIYNFDADVIDKKMDKFTNVIINCKKNGSSYEGGCTCGSAKWTFTGNDAQVEFNTTADRILYKLYFHGVASAGND